MNYTKNYRLPQWIKSDRIMMEDFNAMNSSIENGLTTTAATANAAAAKADTAQQTANTAKQGADNAYSPSNKPYVTGTYTGTGADMTINLGFRPSFVIISGMEGSNGNNVQNSYDRYFAMTGDNVLTGKITFLSTGFRVHASVMYNYNPILSESDRTYDYIAFK